jgi:hypothetical protein
VNRKVLCLTTLYLGTTQLRSVTGEEGSGPCLTEGTAPSATIFFRTTIVSHIKSHAFQAPHNFQNSIYVSTLPLAPCLLGLPSALHKFLPATTQISRRKKLTFNFSQCDRVAGHSTNCRLSIHYN